MTHFVNGEAISSGEIHRETARLRCEAEAEHGPLDVDQRIQLRGEALEIVVDQVLLCQEARRLALEVSDAEIDRQAAVLAPGIDAVAGCRAGSNADESRHEIRRRMNVDRILEHWRSAVPLPRTGEVRDFYRRHRSTFAFPERLLASHIVREFESPNDAERAQEEVGQLRTRVMEGADFASVATEASDCPENGGDLGWFVRGQMVEEFDEVVFSAQPGQLTPVFRTRFGWHFALVKDRKPEGIGTFEEMKEEIVEALWRSSQKAELHRKLAALRAGSTIEAKA